MIWNKGFDHCCSTIWRMIINNENMETLLQIKNGTNDLAYIFFLIVGWYNDEFFQSKFSENIVLDYLLFTLSMVLLKISVSLSLV